MNRFTLLMLLLAVNDGPNIRLFNNLIQFNLFVQLYLLQTFQNSNYLLLNLYCLRLIFGAKSSLLGKHGFGSHCSTLFN